MSGLGLALALTDRIPISYSVSQLQITMGLFSVPELNTRLGTWRAYHLAAIVL
jgi:hypothetical protein